MKSSILLILVTIFSAVGCKKDKRIIDANYKPDITPAKFSNSTNITNKYFPAPIGKKYIYEGQTDEGLEHVEEERTATIKTIMGIECAVVEYHELVNGVLVEK